jgi:hypothetical protein
MFAKSPTRNGGPLDLVTETNFPVADRSAAYTPEYASAPHTVRIHTIGMEQPAFHDDSGASRGFNGHQLVPKILALPLAVPVMATGM